MLGRMGGVISFAHARPYLYAGNPSCPHSRHGRLHAQECKSYFWTTPKRKEMDMPTLERVVRPRRNRISIEVPREFGQYTFKIVMIPIVKEEKPKYDSDADVTLYQAFRSRVYPPRTQPLLNLS